MEFNTHILDARNDKGAGIGHALGATGIAVGSLFLNALIASRLDKGSGADGGSEPQAPSLQQQLQVDLVNAEGTLEGLKVQYDSMTKEIQRLQRETNETEIKAKESEVNKLKDQLYTKEGAYQDNTAKVIQCETAVNTAMEGVNNAGIKIASIDSEIANLQKLKDGADALKSDPDKKDAATQRSNELDAQINAKKQERAIAKNEQDQANIALENAQKAKIKIQQELGNKYSEIQNTKANYDKQSTELATLKEGLATNTARLKELTSTKLPELKAQISEVENQVQALKDKLLDFEGQQALKKKDAAGDYAEANAKDGNWFSRTWQKTKGIFSKSEREEYKQMRAAHKDKKEALSEYKALGGTRSEIKTGEYKDRQSAESKAVDFCKRNTYYQNMSNLAAKFIRTNLDATDAEIKAHLDTIIEKQNE